MCDSLLVLLTICTLVGILSVLSR